jgi:NADPH-dependent 2,4-dienoyl-CoA reductase/sulfur reductase-like enzyme
MPGEETHVIIGASLSGAKAAQTLREEGFPGRLVLVGAENERPYERPPLTKGYLLGKEALEKAYVHDESWYADNNVELRLGVAAVGIDRSAHEVRLADGRRLSYDKLLLTTGASPRRLGVPGVDLAGLYYMRTMTDSTTLRDALRPGDKRVVVVGAGWIGLETAAAAREYGNAVTIVEPQPTPLHQSLGPELGAAFADLHRAHGVDLVLGEGVSALHGSGRVSAVVTSAGQELPADLVIVGVGVVPNTGLAEAAGLEVSDGVVVDESLRTSDPDIYAAGDVANAHNPLLGRRIRVEHWANAEAGGPAAARAMLGKKVAYDWLPFFFTDQYDLGMELSGVATPGEYDEIVYRGVVQDQEYIAFWLSGGRVVAGMNVNVWDVTDDIQSLIRSGAPVDKARLIDPKVPLPDLH